ncbi:S-layer homology domain-containing protein [Candidatus Peregrinibacteria bacterium]|jgi:hypothetical protein|nr:S-layer homology domain-containing protein [Candidatus Peregrinibacteria bacterium]MBT5823551.1 S-layer homology domain-containing protein [Candidatus Peregrinibacteria bacterium]
MLQKFQMQFRIAFNSLVFLSLFTLSISAAFAAANDYGVTGGNPGSLPDAGAAAVSLPTLTLTDAGGDDFSDIDATEIFIVTIDSTNYPNVEFDQSVVAGDLTVAGTCGHTSASALTYTNGYTANVTVTGEGGVGTCGASETITIAGIQIKTTYVASAPGSNDLVQVDNSVTALGTPVVTSNAINLAVAIGDLTATGVNSASPIIGTYAETTTSTIAFTSTADIPNLGKIVVTYPSGYDVSGANAVVATNLQGLDGTWTASVSSQVVTFVQTNGSISSAGNLALTISGILNPTVVGVGGTYTILTEIAAGDDIETDAAVVGSTFIGGATDSLSVTTPASVALENTAEGVKLTWAVPTDDTDQIEILRAYNRDNLDGTPIATVTSSDGTFTDTDVVDGDIISYAIKAKSGSKYGDLSAETKITYSVPVEPEPEPEDEGEEGDEDPTDEEGEEPEEDEELELEDVDGHWAENAIEFMVEAGVIEGNPDGTFDPDGMLNRAEGATLLFRVLGVESTETEVSAFTDMEPSDWYAGDVTYLYDEGLLNGNPDATYEGGEYMNRAEFLTMAM